jgi:PleD family two-component response regulator
LEDENTVSVANNDFVATVEKLIMFVDDEAMVLAGLRTMLCPLRNMWNVVFSHGPEQALAKVATTDFDMVVGDMHLFEMDNAALINPANLAGWTVREPVTSFLPVEQLIKS